MSEVYTVKSVTGPKEWHGRSGPMHSYKLDLDNEGVLERQVELNRKPTSPAPEVGQLVAGSLEETNFGTKLTLDFDRTRELQGGRHGFSRGSSEARTGSKGSWQRESERDPERAARILRQHSQGLAVQMVEFLNNIGSFDGTPAYVELQKELIKWTDWFDEDAYRAGIKAVIGQAVNPTQDAAPQGNQVGAQSSLSASPVSDSQAADVGATEQEILEALDTAGVTVPAARQAIFAYMVSELPPERVVRAVFNLTTQDVQLQSRTRQGLINATETHAGKPLPQGDALDSEEDLPF